MDKVQHFEIPADDVSRARKFYEAVFDWKTIEFPMPGGEPYIGLHTGPVDENNMWKEPGFINGGMFKRGAGFPVTNVTIAAVVNDIDATLKKIKDAGGSVVMEKTEIGDAGLYAYIKDSEGNIIGIWQDVKKTEENSSPA